MARAKRETGKGRPAVNQTRVVCMHSNPSFVEVNGKTWMKCGACGGLFGR